MKNLEKLTNIIESILFVSGTQVSVADIAEKLEVCRGNAECKMQNAELRVCDAIILPPSDEGGGIFARK